MKISSLQYDRLVKEYSPNSRIWVDTLNAFWTGGLICVLGQLVLNGWGALGLSDDLSATATAVTMVFLGALLTGLGIYDRIAKVAGAGTIVPITGFANSVASSAIEYKAEGQVFGIGCKIFTIAGPVILYGILSSWILGVIYYLFTMIP